MSPRTIVLHVGTPKTGTSYLQDVLFGNRRLLRRHRIAYPADRFDAHFLAALDLMQLPWGGLEKEAVGAWDRLVEQVRASEGTAIISHEILARASRAQVQRALRDLGLDDPDGPEIHLVVSARDLVRQIPAEWQENVKHRATLSYAAFLEQLRDPARTGRIASWFWGVQELPDILERWGSDLPPEHVHVVTVPPAGADPGLLWPRFSHVFGLDAVPLDLTSQSSNPSLGVPETALIRRLNQSANKQVAPADYRPLVRELLAHQTLSRRRTSPRLALPPSEHTWVSALSMRWVTTLRERGYDVVGDLDDLLGAGPATAYADPDAPQEADVADAALDAIKALLLENARLRGEESRLHEEVGELRSQRDDARRGSAHRARELAVKALDRSGAGQRALDVYRRVRGRSSRSV